MDRTINLISNLGLSLKMNNIEQGILKKGTEKLKNKVKLNKISLIFKTK